MKAAIIVTIVNPMGVLTSCVILLLGISASSGTGLLLNDSKTYATGPTCILEERLAQCSPESCVQTLNQQDVITSILAVTDRLDRKKGIIIHDRTTESLAQGIFQAGNLTAFLQNKESFNITESIQKQISGGLIILVCGSSCVRDVLHVVRLHSGSRAGESFIPLSSQWLIISDASSRAVVESAAFDIDNIAMMKIPKINCNTKSQTGPLCETPHQCYSSYITVSTLMWTANGRRFQDIGIDRTSGSLEPNTDMYPNRKYGLNGRKLIVTTEEWEPFTIIKKSANNTYIFSGIVIDFLDELSRTLNFSYRTIRPPDNKFGTIENGSWTGIIGQLQRREADLGLSLSIIDTRAKVIDFTYPFCQYYYVMAMKKPGLRETKWFTILYIFQWPVLVTIAAFTSCVVIFIYMAERHSSRRNQSNLVDRHSFRRNQHNLFERHRSRRNLANLAERHSARCNHANLAERHSSRRNQANLAERHCSRRIQANVWTNIAMTIYGVLIMQSRTFAPLSRTGWIMVVSCSFLAILLSATYTGNMAASFMVTENEAPISILQELVAQSKYTWGTLGGGSLTQILQDSNLNPLQKVWQGILKFNKTNTGALSTSFEVHTEKLKRGEYVELVDQYTITNRGDCEISVGKESFLPQHVGVGLQKRSPLKKILSDQVTRFLENGMMGKWIQKWSRTKTSCQQQANRVIAAEGIQLVYLEAAFCILLIGLVLALGCLVIELSVNKCL